MGTRAQIAFDGTTCKVYKHYDGYPSETLKTLIPFVADFMERRGYDEEYMVAQLCCTMINESWERMVAVKKTMPKVYGEVDESKRDLAGFGVGNQWHPDIEYVYVIRDSGTIEVYMVDIDCATITVSGGSIRGRILATLPLGTPVEQAEKVGMNW